VRQNLVGRFLNESETRLDEKQRELPLLVDDPVAVPRERQARSKT